MVPFLIGYSGTWTQDEYQNLFDLVNLDLRVKAHQKIAPSHRQVCDFYVVMPLHNMDFTPDFMFKIFHPCSFILLHSLILYNRVISCAFVTAKR